MANSITREEAKRIVRDRRALCCGSKMRLSVVKSNDGDWLAYAECGKRFLVRALTMDLRDHEYTLLGELHHPA